MREWEGRPEFLDRAEQALDELTEEEREELFIEYCCHCGRKESGCQCWNDN